jgi:hypothetical protein
MCIYEVYILPSLSIAFSAYKNVNIKSYIDGFNLLIR